MTTKKELRQRLDLHIGEITKNYQQLAETQETVKQLQQTAELHTQQLAEWRTLFEQIQSAVSLIRQVAEASITRETARQNKINAVAAEVTKQLDNIAKTFAQQSAADGREFKTINARLDNLEKKTAHDNQQPKRRPPTKTTAPPTTTAPKKAKLRTNARAERPAARNRHRKPARTNPS